ncbi:cytochrome C oxidase copper chaperone-domain-containing protein [Polychytrium aggregatum]|uniref:cytochrome C oxidase copper chaperone-domain-containing protein n=1 Tax=Polychytrium aggregatum TaxID=110093 RepID=UPI0022FEDFEC|nr:cytochrome C oxidase copper chaperone-domain-containing protein [Polychytrium aggregatum]KAI9209330.1 cytochrome C oxidase copper chaperone-domain-containing protein [Polychytrium aggregatum]
MGNSSSAPETPHVEEAPAAPKCKPCCACPDTRKARDECVILEGEEKCIDLIKAHQDCMRSMGFNI